MAKSKKLVCILLVLVMAVTVLGGCGMFTQSSNMYNKTAIIVGNENVSLSTLANAYKNYIQNYYYYIYYYQTMTLSDAFSLAYDSIINSYVMIGQYKDYADAKNLTYNHDWADMYTNSKYVDKDNMTYALLYSKYIIYSSYDSAIESILKQEGYTIAAADSWIYRAEQVKKVIDSIADEKTKVTESDMKLLEEYFGTTVDGLTNPNSLDNYVFEDLTDAKLLARVAELNSRLTLSQGQVAVTAKRYTALQRQAQVNVKGTIQNNYYGQSVEQFFTAQINEVIGNIIVKLQTALVGKEKIESNVNVLLGILSDRRDSLAQAEKETYLFDETTFKTNVVALKDNSFIYDIPETYKDSFIYVKNLLIPFNAEQTKALSDKASELKLDTTDKKEASDEYKAFRMKLAESIVAKNFLDNSKISNVFKYDEDNKTVEIAGNTVLATQLLAVKSDKDFLDLMFKYNTDTAQFNAVHDYVAQVDDEEKKSTSWAKGFDLACEAVYKTGVGTYAIGMTDYGAHIVYYTSKVTVDNLDFTASNIYNTATAEYRFFSTYYDTVINTYAVDSARVARKEMANKIVRTNALTSFLKDNNLTLTER